MTEPPPETIAWLHQAARVDGATYAQVLLCILDRLELLEKAQQPRQDKMDRLIEQDREDDDDPQTLHTIALRMVDTLKQLGVLPEILDTLRRAIREPMQQPTPEAAPVATDEELFKAYPAPYGFAPALRAVYDLGREHGAAQAACPHIRSSDEGTSYCGLAEQTAAAQPTPPAAPAGGLVERVAGQIAGFHDEPADEWIIDARAAIREVAGWLDQRGQHGCSLWLREEADR